MLPEGSIQASQMWKRFRPDITGSLLSYEVSRMKDRLARREIDWVYALKDLDFEIQPGESVGLIGTNGSGKSTLLKILAGVMHRHSGDLKVQGRIGALIEVRAGIEPLLSGRENILLYGGLLGLSRRDVLNQFDRIVEFAQIGHAIDRQVKFYSSGMQMRLGFAVAAFLEPAILLVDEVLAVGDADFQQRCLDRIREVVAEGTTVVFVSHDLPSVNAITRRTIWLSDGRVRADGPSAQVISDYRVHVEQATVTNTKGDAGVEVHDTEVSTPSGAAPRSNEPLTFKMKLSSDQERTHVRFFCGISEGTPDPLFVFRKDFSPLPKGTSIVTLTLPHLPLPKGSFNFWVAAEDASTKTETAPLIRWQSVNDMTVSGFRLGELPLAVVLRSPVYADHAWDVEESRLST